MKVRLTLCLMLPATATCAGDLLPLNDGLYVVDRRLCVMELEQMHQAYGDGVAAYTRSLEGNLLSDNYESACRTSAVSVDVARVNYTALCSGEGEEWEVPSELVVDGKDRFEIDHRAFVRCGSKSATEANTPATSDLITMWHTSNGTCRGSSDPESYLPECGKRELLDQLITQRGWCYTQPGWSGAQNIWHVCSEELGLVQ